MALTEWVCDDELLTLIKDTPVLESIRDFSWDASAASLLSVHRILHFSP